MTEAVRLEELRQDFADCRGDLRHSWQRIPLAKNLDDPGRGAYWSMTQCDRCETIRTALISEDTGEVLKRKYDYPEGYQLDEKVTIAELRVLFRQRELARSEKRRRRSR
jgi:hypothetical protein